MENAKSLDEIYAFYRKDEPNEPSAQTMIRFLDLVADTLRTKCLNYGIGHYRLVIERLDELQADPSRFRTYPPYPMDYSTRIVVCADTNYYLNLSYDEHWDDGPFQRKRSDQIYCRVEEARPALSEMLARLKV
jgi:hypothetical protein